MWWKDSLHRHRVPKEYVGMKAIFRTHNRFEYEMTV
jgi:hypothetical protein